jgi:hypothetical protein
LYVHCLGITPCSLASWRLHLSRIIAKIFLD